MTMQLPTGRRERLPLDRIKPYWRNPRRISDEAVNMLSKSIEDYDYQQPIVVDAEHVIIVGHTRYAAMRRLGVKEADVVVADHLTATQVKEWRVIDNRTGEFSTWDFDKLATEVEGASQAMGEMFFPEFMDGADEIITGDPRNFDDVTDDDEDTAEAGKVEFICPSCYHIWDQEVRRADVLAGHIGPLPDDHDTADTIEEDDTDEQH